MGNFQNLNIEKISGLQAFFKVQQLVSWF